MFRKDLHKSKSDNRVHDIVRRRTHDKSLRCEPRLKSKASPTVQGNRSLSVSTSGTPRQAEDKERSDGILDPDNIEQAKEDLARRHDHTQRSVSLSGTAYKTYHAPYANDLLYISGVRPRPQRISIAYRYDGYTDFPVCPAFTDRSRSSSNTWFQHGLHPNRVEVDVHEYFESGHVVPLLQYPPVPFLQSRSKPIELVRVDVEEYFRSGRVKIVDSDESSSESASSSESFPSSENDNYILEEDEDEVSISTPT